MISTAFVVLAVATGVVVVALALALVVLFVTLSMRGRQKPGAQRRGETRHDVDVAAERSERQRDRDIHDVEEAAERAERQRDRDIAREGREDIGRDR
jgi:hypothetical protein